MPKNSTKQFSTIQYTVTHRFIHNFVQQYERQYYTLRLTETSITSHIRNFYFDELVDVSYKPFSNGQGFLYLHTDEGVFSFLISSNPTQFIESFRTLISN